MTKILKRYWSFIPMLLIILIMAVLNNRLSDGSRIVDGLDESAREFQSEFQLQSTVLEITGQNCDIHGSNSAALTKTTMKWIRSEEVLLLVGFKGAEDLLLALEQTLSELLSSPSAIDLLDEVILHLHDLRKLIVEYRYELLKGHDYLIQAQLVLIFMLMAIAIMAMSEETKKERALRDARHRQVEIDIAQEAERNRIALDLHDDIAQELSWFRMDLQRPVPSDQRVQVMDAILQKVRNLSQSLRAPDFSRESFNEAVQDLIVAAEERSDLRISYLSGGSTPERYPWIYAQVYRIFQELLTNAIRHAGPCSVFLELEEDGGFVYGEYRDNGIGIDRSQLKDSQRLGLQGIRNRVAMMDGYTDMESESDRGVRIRFRAPLEERR